MLLGLIDDNKRSRPLHTGQRAICPFCNGELIAKCGNIYINHWQHKSNPNCDSWKENEGEWHKEWKSHFPERNQEVIITLGGEKHIADVLTDNGVIIEFQNSSISSRTIAVREHFYGNMIWVVNALHFIDNLKLRSVVKHQLHMNKDLYEFELSQNEDFHDDQIQRHELRRQEKLQYQKNIEFKLDSAIGDKNLINEAIESFETFFQELLCKIDKSVLFERLPLRQVHGKISDDLKQNYKSCLLEINKLQSEKENLLKKLNIFSTFSDIHLAQIEYKIIPPAVNLNSNMFSHVFAVLKVEQFSLFPNIISFKNIREFDLTKNNPDVLLLVKKIEFEDSKNMKIFYLKDQLAELTKIKDILENEIKAEALVYLERISKEIENEISNLNQKIMDNKTAIGNISQGIEEARKTKVSDRKEIRKSVDAKQRAMDIEIMKKFKGLYLFEWKNERKSWKAAQKPIYLDVGEDYLFEICNDDLLKKIEKQAFIDMHLS